MVTLSPGVVPAVVAPRGPGSQTSCQPHFMERQVARTLAVDCASLAALVAAPAKAQDANTQVTFTVAPTAVAFAGLGSTGAAVAQFRVSRFFTRDIGSELSAFAILPTGGAASMPACVPGARCQSRSTPRLLNGVLVAPFVYLGNTGLRASLGGGAVRAVGGEGDGGRSSAAAALGIEWDSRSDSRFSPVIGIRVVRLARPVVGARQLVLPGVGLTF